MNAINNRHIILLLGTLSVLVLISALIRNDLQQSFFLGLIFDDARELVERGTITSNFMPIGYSGFLASCISVGGVSGIPACQALVYSGILFLALWFLALRKMQGWFLALGVLVVAFHPVLFVNTWRIHDGNPTVLLLLGFLATGIFAARKKNVVSTVLFGAITGLLLAVRINTAALIVPAFLILFEYEEMKTKRFFRNAAVFLVSVGLLFASVNLAIKQRPFFFPEHGFYNLFSGTNEYASEYLLKDFSGENSHKEALEALGFSFVGTFEERLAFPAETYKELALAYAKSHPFEYIKLSAVKLFTLLRPGYHTPEDFTWISLEGVKRILKILLAAPFFIWVFVVYKTRKSFFEKENLFVFLVAVLYLLPFLIANADPRYRFPVDIIFIVDSFVRAKDFFAARFFHPEKT